MNVLWRKPHRQKIVPMNSWTTPARPCLRSTKRKSRLRHFHAVDIGTHLIDFWELLNRVLAACEFCDLVLRTSESSFSEPRVLKTSDLVLETSESSFSEFD